MRRLGKGALPVVCVSMAAVSRAAVRCSLVQAAPHLEFEPAILVDGYYLASRSWGILLSAPSLQPAAARGPGLPLFECEGAHPHGETLSRISCPR